MPDIYSDPNKTRNMIAPLRQLCFVLESLTYGPGYGGLNYQIRNPKPLDPEPLWKLVNTREPNLKTWLADNFPPRFMRRFMLAAKMKQDHLVGIDEHYNISNDFYMLFLDSKYNFYSCADFTPGDTLEQAQTNKANFICNLVDPQPGEKILDLGCGWGAMLKRICEETDDRENLYGYTLSEEQVKYNDEHNHFNVEFKNFITTDYPKETFDKIYSIGSWEHVRHDDIAGVLKKLHDTLKPGGRMVKHFLASTTEELTNSIVIAQLFFPGSYTPSHARQVMEFEAAGFRIVQTTIHDYRPTLRAWFDNLVASKEQAIKLVGVEIYNRYLVFFAASYRYFDLGRATLNRYVLERD